MNNGVLSYPTKRTFIPANRNTMFCGVRAPEYCYSVERRIIGYTGPLFRALRVLDGAQRDFGPMPGREDVNVRSIKSWAGVSTLANEVRVTKFYNQNIDYPGVDGNVGRTASYIRETDGLIRIYAPYGETQNLLNIPYDSRFITSANVTQGQTTVIECGVGAVRQWWSMMAQAGVQGAWSMNYNTAFTYTPGSSYTAHMIQMLNTIGIAGADRLSVYGQSIYVDGTKLGLNWMRNGTIIYIGKRDTSTGGWYSPTTSDYATFYQVEVSFRGLHYWTPPLTNRECNVAGMDLFKTIYASIFLLFQDPTIPVIPTFDWWNSIPYGLAMLFLLVGIIGISALYRKEVSENKANLKESQAGTISAMNVLNKQEMLAEIMKKTLESSLAAQKTLQDEVEKLRAEVKAELSSFRHEAEDQLDEVKNSIDAVTQALQLNSMIQKTLNEAVERKSELDKREAKQEEGELGEIRVLLDRVAASLPKKETE